MPIIFGAGTPPLTTIQFPGTHPTFPGLEIVAEFHHHLSFLNSKYAVPRPAPGTVFGPLPPPSAPTSLPPAACDDVAAYVVNFKAPPLTQDLWHRRLGHIGQDATRAVITKDYASGVRLDGPISYGDVCVPCLLG